MTALATAAACSENMPNAMAFRSLTGGFDGALLQLTPQVENRKRLVLGGPGDCGLFGCKDYSFTFSDKIDADACYFYPADLDAAAPQDLLDHLDDAIQNRTFLADIDKTSSPRSRVGGVYFNDGNGGQ
jgi:hypothetical protein